MKINFKLLILVITLAPMLSACASNEVNGKYIDIRERSVTLHETELNDDHLPDGEIIKNETGATKGTPLALGDTVIFRDYLDEELGLSIVEVERGDKALKKIEKEFGTIQEAPEGMEYLVLGVKFDSYDSKDEPYPVFINAFEIWSDDDSPNVYKVERFFHYEDTKEDLKTGESTKDRAIFLVPNDEKNLYAVYTYESDDPLWFSLK